MKKKLAVLALCAASAQAGDWYVVSWDKPYGILKHDGKTYKLKCEQSIRGIRIKDVKPVDDDKCVLLARWTGKTIEERSDRSFWEEGDHITSTGNVMSSKNDGSYIVETYEIISVIENK
jgi:hypothetical protein